MKRPQLSEEMLDQPMYIVADAARLSKVKPQRVQRWLSGYSYDYKKKRHFQKPMIPRSNNSNDASFLDLIDLLFIKEFLNKGIPLKRLRGALEEARNILGAKHFARRTFFTHGKNIYLQMEESDAPKTAIMELLKGGQWVIPEIIVQLGERIEFDEETELALRWYPLGSKRPVVVNPLISFGRPSVVNTSIATENVYDLYVAEGRMIDPVCDWFSLEPSQVEAAVEFEEQLAA